MILPKKKPRTDHVALNPSHGHITPTWQTAHANVSRFAISSKHFSLVI